MLICFRVVYIIYIYHIHQVLVPFRFGKDSDQGASPTSLLFWYWQSMIPVLTPEFCHWHPRESARMVVYSQEVSTMDVVRGQC